MVTILFFTHNEAAALARSLIPLVHDAVEGHVAEVIVVDGSQDDATASIAEAAGCALYQADGAGLRDVVSAARSDWLIALEPGARLKPGWYNAVLDHVMHPHSSAACFTLERRGGWFSGLLSPFAARRAPLARGLVISKAQALANLGPTARSGEDLVRGLVLKSLRAEIEPPQKS